MNTGKYFILCSYEINKEKILDIFPGGDTRIEAKEALKELRRTFDSTLIVKALIMLQIGAYNNYMARDKCSETINGLAKPDFKEMQVH